MWCGVLGPLVVRGGDGNTVVIGGSARRLLFGALLSRAGRTVAADVLIEDIWGHVPPRSAAKTLQSHVVRLRDDLGRDEALVTDRTGYRLDLGPDDTDAGQFEGSVRRAAELAANEDYAAVLIELEAALGLWRGDAYEEFADAPFCVAERLRLSELRAFAAEERTDAALRLGRSAELIVDLEKRVSAAPYRERTWEQLMLALYRAGRQADALGAYRRVRAVLADDLGVEPGPELRQLEGQILQQDPELLAAPPVRRRPRVEVPTGGEVCPYLGLSSYSENDGALFVGRERLTAELVGMLADHRVVAVVGASGTGKSSLLRAGLVPALRGGALPGSAAWRVSVITPADAADGKAFGDPGVLVLDQAEDLFGQLDAGQRVDVVGRLDEYVGSGGRLVFALRADFYGRLTEVQPLAAYAQAATALIGPLREDELRRVVIEPAESVGLEIEPALVDTVLDDVTGQPAALPLLSVALVRTWENRRENRLSVEGYRRGGGVASALEAAAEDVYAQLPDAQQVVARRLLVRLAAREGGTWVRRPMRLADAATDEDAQTVLGALAAARLITVGQERVDITHEALLGYWPRLRGWLEERVLAADLLDHLGVAARAWSQAGRPESDLYRGARLQTALDWRQEHPDDVSAVEGEFLDASAAAADADLRTAQHRAQREARGRRRLRAIAAGLAAMVVLAAVGAAVALHERGAANDSAREARSAALSADARRLAALSLAAPDIATSSLLAVAAYRLQDSPDSRGALLSAVERNSSALWRIPNPHRLLRVFATPDGTRLAALDNRRDVHIIDPRTRRQVTVVNSHADLIQAITPDGRELIAYGPDDRESPIGRLSVIDIAAGRRERVLTMQGDMNPEIEPAMSRDGRWVAQVTDQHMSGGLAVDVFDAHDWTAPPRRFAVAPHPVAIAAGRSTVAVEQIDGSVEVRSLTNLQPVAHIAKTLPASGEEPAFALAADASMVAVQDNSDPRRMEIVRVHGGGAGAVTLIPTQTQPVGNFAFSPDGSELAVTTLGGAVNVYSTNDGSQTEALTGHAGPAIGVAWTGTSAATGLYTVGLDSNLVSWSVSATPRLVTLSGPDIVSPDRGETFGSFVLGLTPQQGNGPESQIKLYRADLRTGRWAAWPAGVKDGEYINQFVGSFDGTRGLLSVNDASWHNRIEIWDLVRHVKVGELHLPADTTHAKLDLASAISPDGRTAYCALDPTRIGVFALPSGRYLRSFRIRFSDPDGARVLANPWRFDPVGRLLVAGIDTGPHTQRGPDAVGPNDKRPANQRLMVVDPKTGRTLAQVGMGDSRGQTVAEWAPDGSVLALGTFDGTVTLYDAATLKVIASAGAVEPGFVRTAMFAPDGRTLVTSGTSGSLSFWSVPSMQRIAAPLPLGIGANTGGVYAWYAPDGEVVGFAPDNRRPGSLFQRWFDFRAQPAQLAATACELAGADITPAQWHRYLGDRPYQHVCAARH